MAKETETIVFMVHACLKTPVRMIAALRLLKESPNGKQNVVSIHLNVNSAKFTLFLKVKGIYIICI